LRFNWAAEGNIYNPVSIKQNVPESHEWKINEKAVLPSPHPASVGPCSPLSTPSRPLRLLRSLDWKLKHLAWPPALCRLHVLWQRGEPRSFAPPAEKDPMIVRGPERRAYASSLAHASSVRVKRRDWAKHSVVYPAAPATSTISAPSQISSIDFYPCVLPSETRSPGAGAVGAIFN
jgi:hypothetical protein